MRARKAARNRARWPVAEAVENVWILSLFLLVPAALLLTGHNGELGWLAAEVSARQPSWPAVTSEAGMGTPVPFLVDEDRPEPAALAADLGRRFGADYRSLPSPPRWRH